MQSVILALVCVAELRLDERQREQSGEMRREITLYKIS